MVQVLGQFHVFLVVDVTHIPLYSTMLNDSICLTITSGPITQAESELSNLEMFICEIKIYIHIYA